MATATLTARILSVSARRRISISRLVASIAGVAALLTVTPWPRETSWSVSLDIGAVLLLVAGVMIRIWSSLFVAGRKEHELVMVGPYSVCRNPLYMGSFLGTLGIALASQNLLLVTTVLLSFALIYPPVVRHEETVLARRHGELFRAYQTDVPRFIPRFNLYNEPKTYQFEPRRVRRTIRDVIAFPLVYAAVKVLAVLPGLGILPTFNLS